MRRRGVGKSAVDVSVSGFQPIWASGPAGRWADGGSNSGYGGADRKSTVNAQKQLFWRLQQHAHLSSYRRGSHAVVAPVRHVHGPLSPTLRTKQASDCTSLCCQIGTCGRGSPAQSIVANHYHSNVFRAFSWLSLHTSV